MLELLVRVCKIERELEMQNAKGQGREINVGSKLRGVGFVRA